MLVDAGIITLTVFISPFQTNRNRVGQLANEDGFIKIYCNMNLQTCELSDIQGLYAKARRGEIADCTGISSPYESPLNLEIIVNTGSDSIEVCVNHCYSTILIYIYSYYRPASNVG